MNDAIDVAEGTNRPGASPHAGAADQGPGSSSGDFPPALHFAGLSIYPSVPLRANVFAAACI